MIETDYLVVGAGAAGMAFTDALLARTDATVTIVDRRDAPGGHWRDAYSHVRLHQPSAFYGVDSVPLGQDAIDTLGTNAGYYVIESDEEKNRLCTPIPYWEENGDYLSSFLATLAGNRLRAAHPIIASWTQTSRLNPVSGVAGYRSDPRVVEASERIKRFGAAAASNLQKLLTPAS